MGSLKRVFDARGLPPFHDELRAAAARVVGWGIAEEVVQDCYIKELKLDQERRNIRTWMKRMVYNLAIDRARQESRHEEIMAQYLYERGGEITWDDDGEPGSLALIDSDTPDPEAAWLLKEEISGCLSALTVTQRMVLTLVELWGFTQAEIATELGISQQAVSRMTARAKGSLSSCLKQYSHS